MSGTTTTVNKTRTILLLSTCADKSFPIPSLSAKLLALTRHPRIEPLQVQYEAPKCASRRLADFPVPKNPKDQGFSSRPLGLLGHPKNRTGSPTKDRGTRDGVMLVKAVPPGSEAAQSLVPEMRYRSSRVRFMLRPRPGHVMDAREGEGSNFPCLRSDRWSQGTCIIRKRIHSRNTQRHSDQLMPRKPCKGRLFAPRTSRAETRKNSPLVSIWTSHET